MNKELAKKVGARLLEKTKDKGPIYMSWGAVIGFGVTLYFALKAQPKVKEHVAEAKGKIEDVVAEKGAEAGREEIKQIKKEAALNIAGDVLPAVITGGVSVSLIFGANKLNEKLRKDDVASALALASVSDRALSRYQESTKEVVGEKKEQEIREKSATKLAEEMEEENVPIHLTGKGNTIYMIEWTMTRFKSSRSAIDAAVNAINQKLLWRDEDFVPLNEFYKELGLPATKFGEENGWCSSEGPLEVSYSVAIMPDGNHCISIEFELSKKYQNTNHVMR